MAVTYQLADDADLDASRMEVLAHLRSRERFPGFLIETPDEQLSQKHAEIAAKFLAWLSASEFELEIVNVGTATRPMFEGRWTHKGTTFVGFKQPPAARDRHDATLLACAALLRNEWCRARLP